MMNDDGRLDGLFKQLHLLPTLVSALKTNPYQCTNKRILKLLDKLDTCTTGKCLKPDKWRAKDIAQWLSISESRFLHMVREELGVAWRPYLLWRRLLCAIQAIKNGQSITNAAYIAGFSDSAHLCRTIKRLFGMTSKQLINSFN
jgi:AraC-like DNA-binding protein